MAKTKKFSTIDGTIEINKKSKNETYLVDQSVSDMTNRTVTFDYSKLNPNIYASKVFAIRKNNDLIFVSKISNGTKITKTVTTTFKNYYDYESQNIHIVNNLADSTNIYWESKGTNASKYNPYIYVSGTTYVKGTERYAGSNKADTYKISDGSNPIIYDEKGNDKYNLMSDSVTVYDYAGNDTYTAYNAGSLDVRDYAGNDKYTLYSMDSDSIIYDYAGNDSYSAHNGESLEIADYAGKDKYDFSNLGMLTVDDYKGNDVYNVSYSTTQITDYAGNDKYTFIGEKGENDYTTVIDKAGKDSYSISSSEYVKINDVAGNDKYTVNATKGISITDGEKGSNKGGNDTYSFTSVSNKSWKDTKGNIYDAVYDYAGNDKYNIAYCDNLYINDYAGSNTFNVSDSSDIKITVETNGKKNKNTFNVTKSSDVEIDVDEAGVKDKYTYNITNAENIDIYSKGETDIFNIKNSTKFYVENVSSETDNDVFNITNSSGKTYVEGIGNNKYNIDSSDVDINYDEGGDDTYTIKSMTNRVSINDGGGKDSLIFSDLKKDNLIVTINIKGENDANWDLILLDKNNAGYTIIKDYFKVAEGTTFAQSDGYIETIKAEKTNVSSFVDSTVSGYIKGDYTEIMSSVAGWLKEQNGEGTEDLIETLAKVDDISDLIACFTTSNT